MTTTFSIFGVVGPTGSKAVAALTLPAGLTTAAGTTIAGGTVNGGGTTTVPTGAGQVFLGLTENPTQVYGGTATLAGTPLPDTVGQPYTVEVRQVDPGTDLTSYAAIASAFAAATAAGSELYTPDVPATLAGGFLKCGTWLAQSPVCAPPSPPSPPCYPTPQPLPTDLVPSIAANAGGPRSASGDSGSMSQHSLPDQIAADRYQKAAAAKGLGIRMFKIVRPGAVDLRDCR